MEEVLTCRFSKMCLSAKKETKKEKKTERKKQTNKKKQWEGKKNTGKKKTYVGNNINLVFKSDFVNINEVRSLNIIYHHIRHDVIMSLISKLALTEACFYSFYNSLLFIIINFYCIYFVTQIIKGNGQ